MEQSDKIAAVSRMQAYIVDHMGGEITLEALCEAAQYSRYHAVRMFKELTGSTPFAYARALRLTKAAQTLRDSPEKVVDIALESGFDSHDGFTRAFARQFDITPQKYSRERPPVRWFIHHSIDAYYRMIKGESNMNKEAISRTVTVTAVERPARKLILLRSARATEYLSYCEEIGCEWEGLLNSIPEKFDTAALLTLPGNLITPGTGNTAAGVEVPQGYAKPLPAGYGMIDLPACTLLYFQGVPYSDEDAYCEAIDIVEEAVDAYDPTRYGWAFADALAPRLHFGASAETGARMARPVVKAKVS